MSTSAISSASLNQELQAYYQQRNVDLTHLAHALKSGDLDAARQAYQAIMNLGQHGPFKNGAPFGMANREQDFQAVGKALQAGDLNGAKQALQALGETFHPAGPSPVMAPSSSSAGPDVVVKLSGNQ